MDRRWNDTDRSKQKSSGKKKHVPVPLYLQKLHVDWCWTEPGPLGWGESKLPPVYFVRKYFNSISYGITDSQMQECMISDLAAM